MQRGIALALASATLFTAFGTAFVPAAADPGLGFVAPPADFVDVAQASGLTFTCQHWAKYLGLAPRWFNDVFMCGSPALGDYNGDGYTDIFFPNTRFSNGTLNDIEVNPQDALYLNNGDGTFTDASAFLGLDDRGYSLAAAALDHDDDGDLDIYIANFHEVPTGFVGIRSPSTTFYTNNGDGTFTKSNPAALGLKTEQRCFLHLGVTTCIDDTQFGTAVAVADYDRDGDVDVYRGNYAKYDNRKGMPGGLQLTIPDTNNLFRNDGGVFTDVTGPSGASPAAGRTFGANFVDLNNDLWPDLRVVEDENPDQVLLNRGDGTFEDFSAASGADDPRGGMCAGAADWSGDGNMDLFASHYEDEYDGYYLGRGDGTFEERSTDGDLWRGFHLLSWGCPSLDFDNDADLDLFVANGHMLPAGGDIQHPGDPMDDNGYELPNMLFRNTLRDTGVHSFVDVSKSSGPGLLERFVSSGAVSHDFDLDGSAEILVVENNNVPVSLYQNRAPVLGHWLVVDLRGVASNSHGIGARVEVTSGGITQLQYQITGDSLGSGSAAPLRFGLGSNAGPATVKVSWPSGLVQTESIAPDRMVRIVEGQGVQLDTLAPAINARFDGQRGTNDWWTSPSVGITLDPQDRGFAVSGVASVSYRVDGGALQPYTGTFQVMGEGVHKVTVVASDLAGNKAWYPIVVKIDSVTPTLGLTSPLKGKLYAQDRMVGDAPDGNTVIVVPVKTPNEDAATADAYALALWKQLRASQGLPPDPNPPPTLAGALAASAGDDGLTTVTVTCVDVTSRADRAEFRLDGALMRVDRAEPFDWKVDLRALSAGEHTVTAKVYDKAGLSRVETIRVLVVPTATDGALTTLMLGPSLPGGA